MNFNYLLGATQRARRKCGTSNQTCYFIPAGNVRSMQGNHVHLTMLCRKCGQREDLFLTRQEYYTQQKLIEKELENV